jgi:hypothetical protein
MKLKHLCAATVAAIALSGAAAQATTIKVLWTSGTPTYNANISELASEAATFDPAGNGKLTWDLNFWNANGGAAPVFSDYDVLVVGSTCNFTGNGNCSGSGFFGSGVYVNDIITEKANIAAARGSRTFLSGQDADYHDLRNLPDRDNGPKGFMINAVNWAASGTGMGIVSMTDRYRSFNNGWWTAEGSFLDGEIPDLDAFSYNSDTVTLGEGQENFPINEGLTSAGLSNWSTSSHACFNEISGYARINFAPFSASECGVTIVTAGLEGGGTDGGDDDDDVEPSVVPLPAGLWLMLTGLGALSIARRRS